MQNYQPLIDTHCHFDDPRLDECRQIAYEEATQKGVFCQIIPAIHYDSWGRVKNLCQQFRGLYPCYGLHPLFMSRHKSIHLELLRRWLEEEEAVAVGECGLDYFVDKSNQSEQKQIFVKQLHIANEFDLPVVLHANRAVEDVTLEIRRSRVRNGVVHSFNGSLQQAGQLIDLGFKLSFGGAITYSRAKKLRQLIQNLPIESIMLETDAPDQSPAQHQGEINKPAYITHVFSEFCRLRSETPECLARQLNQNAIDLFRIKHVKPVPPLAP